MEKFETIEAKDKKIEFRLITEDATTMSHIIVVRKEKNHWEWHYYVSFEERWYFVYIENNTFVPHLKMDIKMDTHERYDGIIHQIKTGFHELFKQLKSDQNYRLKLLNMLDDDTRRIWEKI